LSKDFYKKENCGGKKIGGKKIVSFLDLLTAFFACFSARGFKQFHKKN
jgi:hypothetical protein